MNIRLGTVGFAAPAGREKDAKRYDVTMCGEMRKEDVCAQADLRRSERATAAGCCGHGVGGGYGHADNHTG